MLTEKIWKHFGLSRDPFSGEMTNPQKDVYPLHDTAVSEVRIDRAIKAPGMAAVIGDVGTGKSTMLHRQVAKWEKSSMHKVIQVHSFGRYRLSSSQLADAMMYGLAGKILYASEEVKAIMIRQIIAELAKQTVRAILVIDDAHELPTQTMKSIKKMVEAQGKFGLNLAVVLAGHPPLEQRLRDEVALREIYERIDMIRLQGVSAEDGRDYLSFKLSKANGTVERLFDPDGLDLLLKHPSARYPLGLNNLVEAAMYVAYDIDEHILDVNVVQDAFHGFHGLDGAPVKAKPQVAQMKEAV